LVWERLWDEGVWIQVKFFRNNISISV
jgi:hypothetical protein